MDDVARVDCEYEQVVGLASMVDAWEKAGMHSNRWLGVVERCLHQAVAVRRLGIGPFDAAVVNADDDHAALGIGERHERFGELVGVDANALAIEPLVLDQPRYLVADVFRYQAVQVIDGRTHGFTRKSLQ